MEEIILSVPMEPVERTDINICQLKQFLISNNLFFYKIQNIMAVCLLKLNNMIWFEKNEVIYESGG
jgi:hypothetical protein